MLRLVKDGVAFRVETVWRSRVLGTKINSAVLLGGQRRPTGSVGSLPLRDGVRSQHPKRGEQR